MKSTTALLPTWFRGMLVALATVLLCSCQAPLPTSSNGSSESTLRILAVDNDALPRSAVDADQSPVNTNTEMSIALPNPPVANAPAQVRPAGLQPNVQLATATNPGPLVNQAAELAPVQKPRQEPSILTPEEPYFEIAQALGCEKLDPNSAKLRQTSACGSGNCPSVMSPNDLASPSDCTNGCTTSDNGSDCQSQGCQSLGCEPCLKRVHPDEYLCDGGDCGLEIGVREDWTIDGLEQEDTAAHYDTLDGRVLVVPSNKVCIYAPRFGAVRQVVNPVEAGLKQLVDIVEEDTSLALADLNQEVTTKLQNLPPVASIGQNPPSLLLNRQQAGELEGRVVLREIKDLIKPHCNLQIVKLGIHDNSEKARLATSIVSALTWSGDQAPQVTLGAKALSVLVSGESPGVVYAGPKGKPCLRLVKLASTDHAQPGDEIEFTLRFDNVGTEKIGNVTIVDNLTTRLAYVTETAEASVEADFTTSENAAGSLVLRWEIKDPVEPGKGGVIQFKVRVR